MESKDIFEGTTESNTSVLLARLMQDYKKRKMNFKVKDNKIIWNNGIDSHEITLSNSAIFIDGYRAKLKPEDKETYIELGQFLFAQLPLVYRIKAVLGRHR